MADILLGILTDPTPGSITKLVTCTCTLVLGLKATWKVINAIIRYRQKRKQLEAFDGPPPHWLYGNLKTVPKYNPFDVIVKLFEKYGPAMKFHLGPFIQEVSLGNSEFVQAVMNTSEPKDHIYTLLNPWLGNGLLLSSGKKWARNRRLLTPSFHFEVLKPYQKLFSDTTMVLVSKWQNMVKAKPDESVEMFEHVSLLTLDSLMKCIFSNKSNLQAGLRNPYIDAVYEVSDLIVDRLRFLPYHSDWIFYFSYMGYKLRRAVHATHKFSMSIIHEKKRQKACPSYAMKSSRYLDFLDMLLDCRDEEGRGLTDKEIQDEVDTFMFEGHDTTASGICWCLYNLARHPEYQEKCRQELLPVLRGSNEVTWEDLSKLPYLTQCIKESLRLHPPVTRIGREVTRAITLPDGRVIPEGTMVAISIYMCHHDANVWPNPEVYDPERFTQENCIKRLPQAFVPFSAGPRNCIGQNFAMNELKTVMALILKHFRLSVDDTKKATKHPALVLRSLNGIWLNLEPLQ